MAEAHKIVMYPVGNGDTTQIIMAKGRRFLFDFNRCKVAEDDKAPRIDLHKRLKEELKEAKRDYGVMGCPALDTPVALTKAAKIAANFVKFGWSKAVVPCSSVGEESGEEFGEKGGYLGTLSEEKPNRSTLSPPSRVSSSPIAPTKSEAGKPLSFSGLPAFSLLGNCAAVAWDLRRMTQPHMVQKAQHCAKMAPVAFLATRAACFFSMHAA